MNLHDSNMSSISQKIVYQPIQTQEKSKPNRITAPTNRGLTQKINQIETVCNELFKRLENSYKSLLSPIQESQKNQLNLFDELNYINHLINSELQELASVEKQLAQMQGGKESTKLENRLRLHRQNLDTLKLKHDQLKELNDPKLIEVYQAQDQINQELLFCQKNPGHALNTLHDIIGLYSRIVPPPSDQTVVYNKFCELMNGLKEKIEVEADQILQLTESESKLKSKLLDPNKGGVSSKDGHKAYILLAKETARALYHINDTAVTVKDIQQMQKHPAISKNLTSENINRMGSNINIFIDLKENAKSLTSYEPIQPQDSAHAKGRSDSLENKVMRSQVSDAAKKRIHFKAGFLNRLLHPKESRISESLNKIGTECLKVNSYLSKMIQDVSSGVIEKKENEMNEKVEMMRALIFEQQDKMEELKSQLAQLSPSRFGIKLEKAIMQLSERIDSLIIKSEHLQAMTGDFAKAAHYRKQISEDLRLSENHEQSGLDIFKAQTQLNEIKKILDETKSTDFIRSRIQQMYDIAHTKISAAVSRGALTLNEEEVALKRALLTRDPSNKLKRLSHDHSAADKIAGLLSKEMTSVVFFSPEERNKKMREIQQLIYVTQSVPQLWTQMENRKHLVSIKDLQIVYKGYKEKNVGEIFDTATKLAFEINLSITGAGKDQKRLGAHLLQASENFHKLQLLHQTNQKALGPIFLREQERLNQAIQLNTEEAKLKTNLTQGQRLSKLDTFFKSETVKSLLIKELAKAINLRSAAADADFKSMRLELQESPSGKAILTEFVKENEDLVKSFLKVFPKKVSRESMKIYVGPELNEKFQNYKELIDKLQDPKNKSLKLESLSAGNREPAITILHDLYETIHSGATSFEFSPNIFEAQSVNFNTLAEEFLKTPYVRNLIKQSPEIALTLAAPQLNKIKTIHGPTYEETTAEFHALIAKKDVDAILKLCVNLPKSVEKAEALKRIKTIEEEFVVSSTTYKIPLTFSAKQVVKEIISTEESFLNNIRFLMGKTAEDKSFFELLLDAKPKLINVDEYNEMTTGWDALIKEGEKFFKILEPCREHLQNIDEKKIAYKEQNPTASEEELQKVGEDEAFKVINLCIEAFSPAAMDKYLNQFEVISKKYNRIRKKIESLKKSESPKVREEALKIYEAFAKNNNQTDPLSVIIMPIQRVPRYGLLLKELIKQVSVNDSDALNKDLQILAGKTQLINSAVDAI